MNPLLIPKLLSSIFLRLRSRLGTTATDGAQKRVLYTYVRALTRSVATKLNGEEEEVEGRARLEERMEGKEEEEEEEATQLVGGNGFKEYPKRKKKFCST